jgi:CDGSH iron-sulfur domain-containing protein 3
MAKPTVAGAAPLGVDVQAGKSYWWCACGLSKSQPFCDGSHKGGDFSPTAFKPEKDGKVWFCTCKQSAKAPLCDGSHKQIA